MSSDRKKPLSNHLSLVPPQEPGARSDAGASGGADAASTAIGDQEQPPAPEFRANETDFSNSKFLEVRSTPPLPTRPLSGDSAPGNALALTDLPEHTREVMKKGSKSFSLAALLFDKESREGAQYLYAWCRTCDDEIDDETDPAKQIEKLNLLREKTARAFADQPVNDPAFQAFRELCRKYKIEEAHPQELLEGMRMDVEGSRIRNDEDLILYCYRVAGVVGLMMAQVMGVQDQKALRHAIDTGLAMQMSNIARDIKEDFNLKRIYIPDNWFPDGKLPSLNEPFRPEDFTPHVERLLAKAEALYVSGEQGLKYLPFRASLAVAAAQTIYREIGRKVLRRGTHAWDTRTVVSKPRKLWLMLIAILKRCQVR